MKTRFDLKSSLQENKLFFSRASLLSLFVLVLFFILIVRLAYLQIKTHDEYADLAQNNRVKLSVIAPVRGLIFDTHGRVLAENNPSYSLELVPEQIQNINETIERLRTLLPISDAEIKLFEKRRKQQKHFANVPLRNRLNDTEVAVFSANRHLFPGVDIQARPLRHYPFPELTFVCYWNSGSRMSPGLYSHDFGSEGNPLSSSSVLFI